jgi:putative nucleotidyltransferase with HDIG domain
MAIALAKAAGVTDAHMLKAIHAAALLHDTGKLAVPEHILNKPGKLTPAEFERMKRHAAVGADILSAIDFPYPVVPIVRHHHENWDGTGYPDGLSGTNIPVGARILSVVDCYDALTSDRPYRRALSDQEALTIVRERRGTMYDPLVVDAFVTLQSRVERPAAPPAQHAAALAHIAQARHPSGSSAPTPAPAPVPVLDETTEEVFALSALAASLSPSARMQDVGLLISYALRRLVPCTSAMVIYGTDAGSEEVVARHATPTLAPLVGRRTDGHQLSAWVAHQRQPIVNSDAELDLGQLVRSSRPALRKCLAVPLTHGDRLVGVLALYTDNERGFQDSQLRLVQLVAPHLAEALEPLLAAESSPIAESHERPNLKLVKAAG